MNKIALVTGASKGIGAAISKQLASDGFDLILHYNSHKEEAESLLNQIKTPENNIYLVQADLTKVDEVSKLKDEISKYTDKLDLLVNNAGADIGYLFEDYTFEQLHYVLDANLWTTINTTKILLPLLKSTENSQIINIVSRLGKEKSMKTASIYGAAKAAVIKLSQVLTLELAKYKIRVNCVAPGLTRTELTENIFIRDEGGKEAAEKVWTDAANSNPVGRVALPQDIANVVSFLASAKAEYINGEVIGVNGGSNLA